MDATRNPFAPSTGRKPPVLAGRDAVLNMASIACSRTIIGRSARSIMLLGLRGTGKSVLLDEIRVLAREIGLLVALVEEPSSGNLAHLLYPQMLQVLRSLSCDADAQQRAFRGLSVLRGFSASYKCDFSNVETGVECEPGLADSGDLQHDLPVLFEIIGQAAQAAGSGWLLLFDEVQCLSQSDLLALIVAIHRMAQARLPILFVGAGLPQVARLAGDARSYSERLFIFTEVGALEPCFAIQAIEKLIQNAGASIATDALITIVARSRGYPFFFVEWASIAWDIAEGPVITLDDVENSYDQAWNSLEKHFFQKRLGLLTDVEFELMKLLSSLGDGPYSMSDIANAFGGSVPSISPSWDSIISKGVIYSVDGDIFGFTAPFFAEFMRGQN